MFSTNIVRFCLISNSPSIIQAAIRNSSLQGVAPYLMVVPVQEGRHSHDLWPAGVCFLFEEININNKYLVVMSVRILLNVINARLDVWMFVT